MKRLMLIGVATMVALCGCVAAPAKVWNKAGITAEQFARDKMACRQYGMQSATANGLAGNLFVEKWISDEAGKCLRDLGYYQQ